MRQQEANATLREDNPRYGMIKKKREKERKGENIYKEKNVSYVSKRKFQRDLLIRD